MQPSLDDFGIFCDAVDDLHGAHVPRPLVLEHYTKLLRIRGLSEGGIELWASVGQIPPEERYPRLEAAAEAAGLDGWGCEPLRELLARRR